MMRGMQDTYLPVIAACRLPYALPENEAQRLFHGRGGGFPGLQHVIVDWLPPVLLITLYAEIPRPQLNHLATQIMPLQSACESVVVQYRYEREGPTEALLGDSPAALEVSENGLTFEMTLGTNRNTGLFLDMRNGRTWVREHAREKRVLNLFAYTCGFSVAAMAGGADAVVNVDMSGSALSQGRRNHMLNDQDITRVRFEKVEIFRSFGRLARLGPFDLLVCDPPTLQKGNVNIERDYPKIIRRLDRFMATEADLLMCLNAPRLDESFLLEAMDRDAPGFAYQGRVPLPDAFIEPAGGGMKALHFRRERP